MNNLSPTFKFWTIALMIVLLAGIATAGDTPLRDPVKRDSTASTPVALPTSVLSFEHLDRAKEYEDLPRYGLLPPGRHNHKAGKNLIMLALKADSYLKGDWVTAIGRLGTTMLDVDVRERIAYQSVFRSIDCRFKMPCSYHYRGDNFLLIGSDRTLPSSGSIVVRREAVIFAISDALNSRYIYGNDGNFARSYDPEPDRKSHAELKSYLMTGLDLLEEFRKSGYRDGTLKDTLGMGYASLEYDGVRVSNRNLLLLHPLQIYSDALNACLTRLRKVKDHSEEVLDVLGWEMDSRGLATQDGILLPAEEDHFPKILDLISEDLDNINQGKQPSIEKKNN